MAFMIGAGTAAADGITNGDFEMGTLSGWSASGASSAIVTSGCRGGAYCARLGATTATKGDSTIRQTFTAPAGATTLTVFYKVVCPDTVSYDWALATLTDNTTATSTTVLPKTCTNNGSWASAVTSVTPGHSYTLALTSHDDNWSTDPTYTLYDDVSITVAGVPSNTGLPTIGGATAQGSTLSATTGTWTSAPTSYAYQWQRCDAGGSSCQTVSGISGSTYALGSADVDSRMRVSVTAANAVGSATVQSAVTAVVGASSDPLVVAVGDIACAPGDTSDSCRQQQTASLAAAQNPNAVIVLGDNQYDSGLYSEYEGAGAYNATWGVFNPIVHPVPGNHEYAASSSAAGYFQYFGAAAHASPGYYSYNLGTWHIVALNSDCSDTGCPDTLAGTTSTAQTSWLQSDLAANRSACVLAYWHHPLFSSGWVGDSPGVAPLWNALYNAHADVVLGGHDHLYERYAQQNTSGAASSAGVREFVVGTGGEYLMPLTASEPNLQASDTSDFGVLVLTLHASSYDWAFKRLNGTTVDSGTATCHGPGTLGASRDTPIAHSAPRREPQLQFGVRLLRSVHVRDGQRDLPVAVHCSRACDVTVTIWLRRHHRQRIVSLRETESQIPSPYSRIVLPLPSWLSRLDRPAIVIRLVASDAAGHQRIVMRNLMLGRR